MTNWERRAAETLAFVRRRVSGDYACDDFGYDPDFADHVVLPIERVLYRHWFDITAEGLENVPDAGGALVVANHSGVLPVDALMAQVALYDHHPARRMLRLLAADLVYKLPVLGHMSRKAGHTLACPEDAHRLLRDGELVGVFPEGFKGVGKPYGERYKLQRFGRGGFISTAIRARVPILPCAIVGAEEIYPKIGDIRVLARLFGLPYFPVTPTFPWLGPLGAIPLPTRWIIGFGTPIRTDAMDPDSADDPHVVATLTADVRQAIQTHLDELLEKRGPAF